VLVRLVPAMSAPVVSVSVMLSRFSASTAVAAVAVAPSVGVDIVESVGLAGGVNVTGCYELVSPTAPHEEKRVQALRTVVTL